MAAALAACARSASEDAGAWDGRGAAAYLDRRMEWWMGWAGSQRDHHTFCVSCHTVVPYALARPRLRALLAGRTPGADERRLLDDVRERVRLWDLTGPYYEDARWGPHKAEQSRGTEAVVNALVLTSDEAGRETLGAATRAALAIMWREQQLSGDDRGAWAWLDFDLAPWEVSDSRYYGATLAALAVGLAPPGYTAEPAVAQHLQLLRAYLEGHFSRQSLHLRMVLLWVSTRLPALMDGERRAATLAAVGQAQNPDGGWSLATLNAGSARPGAVRSTTSDGYATALAVLVLGPSELPEARAAAARGALWLERNQQPAGYWVTASLNKQRDPSKPAAWFMNDAATAYAVLALSDAKSAATSAPRLR